MPVSQYELRIAAARYAPRVKTLNEARAAAAQTAFLCHSHQDETLVKGLVTMLTDAGWNVYVDWQDTTLPAVPDRQTASRIQDRIRSLTYFLFLATANSMESRWCPWEIGYANGVKEIDRILIVPTVDGGNTHGNEYLQLYRRIDIGSGRAMVVTRPGYITGIGPRDL
jgi:hypothetical protein